MKVRPHSLSPSAARGIAVLCAALFTSAPVAQAGTNVWTRLGPEGGSITAVAIDPVTPGTLYAGTGAGVFKSTNHGGTWTAMNSGLPEYPDGTIDVRALALDPVTPSTLYAAVRTSTSAGVFKSTDAGASWASTGLSDVYVYSPVIAIAIDPITPSTLYAGTYGSGLRKSTDAGATWHTPTTGINVFNSLAIDPKTPTTVYAGADDKGVFKSTDGGAHWAAGTGFLPSSSTVTAVVIDPVTPSTVYAAATGTAGAVYKSTDAGANWKALDTGTLNDAVEAVVMDPIEPATLYVGTTRILKSTDAGATWKSASVGLPKNMAVSAVAIDPFAPSTVYAGTGGFWGSDGLGVFRSTDAGATWSHTSTGLPAVPLNTLVVDPAAPDTLYGTIGAFFFKSKDAGETWTATGLGDYTASLGIDPFTPSTLYVGTVYSGVRKSTDGGVSWTAAGPGFSDVFAIAIDPLTPDRMYTVAQGTVMKSTDAGATWSDVGPTCATLDLESSGFCPGVCGRVEAHTLAIDPVTSATLYAYVEVAPPPCFFAAVRTADRHEQRNALVKSTDGGATWNEVGTGLRTDYSVVTLAIDPSAPRTLYAGTDGVGVFKSTDAGVTWVGTGLTDGQVTGLLIDPVTPGTLYAGTDSSGVFKSTNAGATWSMLNTGLPNTPTIFALVIDPITRTTLFAATSHGVFSIQQVDVCAGDCDTSGSVTIDELLTLVNIALGNPGSCPNAIPAGATVDVALIVQAVNNALGGCGG